MNRASRRLFLKGLAGATVGLPLLESLPLLSSGCTPPIDPNASGSFAIFMRQPAGVATAQDTVEIGAEPERFWPRELGPLTRDNVEGRALEELEEHLSRLLVVGNVNGHRFDYGDGHANGALQGLTARGPQPGHAAPFWEPDGESIDNLIARHLQPSTPSGQDGSLYLHAGAIVGWLGGACISHRAAGERHTAERDPSQAFLKIMGAPGEQETAAATGERRRSVNDLVRTQMTRLLGNPRLSSRDRARLNDHFEAIRDVELRVMCQRDEDLAARMDGAAAIYSDPNGPNLVRTVELHLEVAALAVACGATRSVVIQIGDGNGGDLRFVDENTGELMENYHFVSHRRLSHLDEGEIIAGSEVQHAQVDRQFARWFRHLLDVMNTYQMPDGRNLLESGVACWYNDNSNGPQHCVKDNPWVLAGSAGGRLRQGLYVDAVERPDTGRQCTRDHLIPTTLQKMHNTVATAVGARKPDGGPIDDFGDPSLAGGLLDAVMTS